MLLLPFLDYDLRGAAEEEVDVVSNFNTFNTGSWVVIIGGLFFMDSSINTSLTHDDRRLT